MKNDYEKTINDLYTEIENSSVSCRGSKKNLASELPRDECIALLDWDGSELPITVQADLLSLNRSSVLQAGSSLSGGNSPQAPD
ncbi:hypothetical protein O9H85_15905 [Paenibacillus filicis]|uniref:Uncharacterized protein n=1 Tax=Paenibacillus gyeongsangnamensis TaxID=3388067 RepID=A0ABT4QAH1_9BACL|nr:hypothetical protein [Paenibacillus filicis]MCZ8513889.1 hypothetical protein [Paenibacillus filicis]